MIQKFCIIRLLIECKLEILSRLDYCHNLKSVSWPRLDVLYTFLFQKKIHRNIPNMLPVIKLEKPFFHYRTKDYFYARRKRKKNFFLWIDWSFWLHFYNICVLSTFIFPFFFLRIFYHSIFNDTYLKEKTKESDFFIWVYVYV